MFATERGGRRRRRPRLLDGVIFGQLGAEPEPIEFYRDEAGAVVPVAALLADLDVTAYDGLMLAGGHAPGCGSTWEQRSCRRTSRSSGDGGPVGAICHGVLVLARSKDAEGVSVLADRRTTCLPKYMERGGYLLTVWKLGRYYRTYPRTSRTRWWRAVRHRASSSAGRARPSGGPAPTTRRVRRRGRQLRVGALAGRRLPLRGALYREARDRADLEVRRLPPRPFRNVMRLLPDVRPPCTPSSWPHPAIRREGAVPCPLHQPRGMTWGLN